MNFRSSDSRIGAKQPPSNPSAEKALIGSVLLGGHATFDATAPIVADRDFLTGYHADIWRACRHLRDKDEPLDPVAIKTFLVAAGVNGETIERIIFEALESVPHQGRAVSYSENIVAESRRRDVIAATTDLLHRAYDHGAELDESIATARKRLDEIAERKVSGIAATAADLMHALVQRAGKARKPGIQTGFADVDAIIKGYFSGQLIVLGARPSVGKTAFAMNVAENISDLGNGVLIVSLEQSQAEVAERLVCNIARISSDDLNSLDQTEATRDSIVTAASRIAEWKMIVTDEATCTVSQIAAVTRLYQRSHSIKLLIVDYLQLIRAEDRRLPREQQVSEIARALKLLARTADISVMALAQLNREMEKRPDKRPRLSDLRESGAIEQDADIVMFLDRPGAHDDDEDPTQAELIIAKHRNGPKGRAKLHWHQEQMRFANASIGDRMYFPPPDEESTTVSNADFR